MKKRAVAALTIATLWSSQSLAQSGAPLSDIDWSKEASNPSFIGCSPNRMTLLKPPPTGTVHLPPLAIQFAVIFGDEPTDHPSAK